MTSFLITRNSTSHTSAHSRGHLVPVFQAVEIHCDFANRAMPSQVETPASERLLSFYEVSRGFRQNITGGFQLWRLFLPRPTHPTQFPTQFPLCGVHPGALFLGEKLLGSSRSFLPSRSRSRHKDQRLCFQISHSSRARAIQRTLEAPHEHREPWKLTWVWIQT